MSKFNVGDKVRVNTPGEWGHEFEGKVKQVYAAAALWDYNIVLQTGIIWAYKEAELEAFTDEPELTAIEKVRELLKKAEADPSGGDHCNGYEMGVRAALDILEEA